MATSVRFRPIEHRDIPECAKVFIAVFGNEPWDEDWNVADAQARLDEIYHTPGFYGVVAADGDDVLGFAMGHVEQWQRGKKHFYLVEMCVLPNHQQRGLGASLMQTLCGDLAKTGVEVIYLLTAQDSAAQGFYEKLGFEVNPEMILMGKYL
jgi:aminoglycoside 6'-N-acetyltransferase I